MAGGRQPHRAAPDAPAARSVRSSGSSCWSCCSPLWLGGAYEGWQWWSVGRFFVATDDAYVQADISVLAAKVSGYLDAVPVVNGQSVTKGDVIAKLDDGDYRLALQAAQDKLATQQSTITAHRPPDRGRAGAGRPEPPRRLDATRADAVRAQADFTRSTQMQADYVAKSRIDQTRADRDRTEASVKAMEAGLVAARANVDVLQAQKREAESLAAELRTAVDRARRDLDFTVIRAPFDGVVGNKAVEAGAYVGRAPGSPPSCRCRACGSTRTSRRPRSRASAPASP